MTPRLGLWVAALVATFIILSIVALFQHAETAMLSALWHDEYYWHVTRFSLKQACLSVTLSVIPAIWVAVALHRRQFRGRDTLVKFFSTTLVMPVLVGVFGLLAIWGKSGLVTQFLHWLGIPTDFSIYGLQGILLAHVFFNLPYSARLLLHSLQAIPTQQYKLAAHLGMSPWQRFRFIEWPRLRLQLPSVAGLVFMLCFTSFATVMALGGGPSSTTIELAIYQAIKYDFDLATGAWLAVWQILLCSSFALFFQHFSKVVAAGSGSSSDERIAQPDSWFAKMGDGFAIFMVVIIVFPPLLMVLGKGLTPELWQVMFSSSLWNALWDSLRVALVAGTLAVSAGISIIWSSRVLRINGYIKRADFTELCGSLILLTPGLVISTGLFLLLRPIANIQQMGYGIVVLVNAMMALPYVLKTLAQPMFVVSQRYNQLCSALGVSGWTRFRLIEWRELREPMVHACVISFLVSMGDLSAIALFGNQDFRTLPLYLYQLLGSYQMDAAAAVAFVMLCISGGAFVVSSRLFRAQRKSC